MRTYGWTCVALALGCSPAEPEPPVPTADTSVVDPVTGPTGDTAVTATTDCIVCHSDRDLLIASLAPQTEPDPHAEAEGDS